MTSTNPSTHTAAPSKGLFQQVQGLDDRFWIVNTMEMLERLAYYGVRAVVAIYMVLPVEQGGPGFTHVQKGAIFAAWASVQSVLPVFTGGLADRWGHKKTIAVAIALKIVGYLLMGALMSYQGFFVGCMFLAAGTAVFKPGVQGTLAATLKDSNASVGWAIFYQLVNIGGFLGPIVAGILRNTFSWAWVFYACAIIVAVNYLWLPFFQDPTQSDNHKDSQAEQTAALAALSQSVTRTNAGSWFAIWTVALGLACWHWWHVATTGEVLVEWMYVLWALLFSGCLGLYLLRKDDFDQGQSDLLSVFVVTVAGLFQPRVLWFCILFAGFWLMFNQVFDLLPNVIEDWVDTAMLLDTLGYALTNDVVVMALTVAFAAVMGLVVGGSSALSLRPDQRPIHDVSWAPYLIVALALGLGAGLWLMAVGAPLGVVWMMIAASVVGLGGAAVFRQIKLTGRWVALFAAMFAAVPAAKLAWFRLLGSGETLRGMAAAGEQVNPEWIINLNPGLIVLSMVFFGYLTSFVRPLTSILIGMVVATIGAYVAGTATVGVACLLGIGIFSVGEMLSSPKKMEFLATLARKGQEGTFMGYANMPVAIGWILGSIGAGAWYEEHGDKKNLAMQYMETELNVPRSVLDALPRSELVPELARRLGQQPQEVQQLLFETYQPHRIWMYISAIGVASILGMFVYAMIIRLLDTRESKATST